MKDNTESEINTIQIDREGGKYNTDDESNTIHTEIVKYNTESQMNTIQNERGRGANTIQKERVK